MNGKNTGKGIGFKLAFIMLAVILFGIIITAGVSITMAGNVIIDESLKKIENETKSASVKIDGWLSNHKIHTGTLAKALSKFDDFSTEYLRPIFEAEIKENSSYQEVYMGFPDDTAVMGNFNELDRLYATGWKASQRGWYQLALTDTSQTHITSPYIDSSTGVLCISASRAVVDGSKILGVAATDLLIDVVEEQTNSVTLGSKDGYAVLLDKNGDILIHPDSELAPDAEGNFKNLATVLNGAYAELWSRISDSETLIKYRDAAGKMKYYTVNTLESTGWKFMTILPSSSIYSPIIRLVLVVIPLTLAIIAAAAVIVLRAINTTLTKPLNAIIAKLTGSSKSIRDSVNQMSESSENLAVDSSKQAAAIEETSATMNETSSMVQQNAENTRIAANLTSEANQIVGETGKYMTELMNTMTELKESSDKVGKIVKTIDDIAFQTNLLAINATVEAARAGGDAGRSFAVVAQEVRDLAQKSAKSSSETAGIINKNIFLTDSSRTAAEQTLTLAQKNAQQITELGKLISEINAASDEQSSGIKQINAAVSQMEKVTQTTAAIAEENAASNISVKNEITNLEDAVDIVKNLVGNKN